MKKQYLWLLASLFVAAFALTSCSDDDDDDNSGGGSGVAADNTLVYDGKTYKLETQFAYPNNAMGWVMIQSVEKDANGEPIIRTSEELHDIHVYAQMVGLELDLTKPYDDWPGYSFGLEGKVNFLFYANYESMGGTIEGQEYNGTSAFKNGKMKVSLEGNNFVWVINGETKNGHKISLRVNTSANGWAPAAN